MTHRAAPGRLNDTQQHQTTGGHLVCATLQCITTTAALASAGCTGGLSKLIMLLQFRPGRSKQHQLQSNAGWSDTSSVNLDELSGQSVAVTGSMKTKPTSPT